MRIAVFGSGYVGLVTSACLAEMGNFVICVDINSEKINHLKQGMIPIYEPGLSELILKNASTNNIRFTTDAKSTIQCSDIVFIAVGTPPLPDGSADVTAIFNVVNHIKKSAKQSTIVVIKSTVPIGTTDSVQKILKNHEVVFNPEFLKQGEAVSDSMNPDRIVIGTSSERVINTMKNLYRQCYSDEKNFLVMNSRSAEMTKYVANAMLATKISFINEMSQIADRVGADIYQVRDGIALDKRIGPYFINPGLGYGGSCFSKDIKALQQTAKNRGYCARILQAIEDVNYDQKSFLFDKIMRFYKNDIRGKKFAILGLSFKPNTDDIRDAASITFIKRLMNAGATIQVYDPQAMSNFKKQFDGKKSYVLCGSVAEVVKHVDALCIVTEWDEFKSLNLAWLSETLLDHIIFDGRNVLNKKTCEAHQLQYICI